MTETKSENGSNRNLFCLLSLAIVFGLVVVIAFRSLSGASRSARVDSTDPLSELVRLELESPGGWEMHSSAGKAIFRKTEFASLDAIFWSKLRSGWEVIVSPDLPGPYRRQIGLGTPIVETPGAKVRFSDSRGFLHEIPIPVGRQGDVFPLETMSGEITHVVLVR